MDICLLFLLMWNYVVVRGDFNLVLLHTNDVHARVEQTNKYGSNCSTSDVTNDKCYGGVARRKTVIDDVRRNNGNVLLLDAGDEFQGSIWFTYYKGLEASHFMNKLGYDAMCTGNHEFDNGASGLQSPFLDNATFPVLACNLNITNNPELKARIQSHVVLIVGGEKIGVIGYITAETQFLVRKDAIEGLQFDEILPCIRDSVSDLQDEGVNKIIALGHSGYPSSKQVASISGVDIVVDGHSNTFLYNGDSPSSEKVMGPYPTVISQPDGGTGLVYQAYAFGKYLGMAQLTFDDDGKVTSWSGNPILLDKSYQQDASILEEVASWREPLLVYTQTVIGESYVVLQGGKFPCRLEECNLGNLLTDAIFYKHIRPTATAWTQTRIVLMNSGGIRVSLPQGKITPANIFQIHPFQNTIGLVQISGATLRLILEHSLTGAKPDDPPGRFLQISGLKVVYDMTKPEGSRVVDVMVTCTSCDVPKYEVLDDDTTYGVFTNDYMIEGGDGYKVLEDNLLGHEPIGTLVTDALKEYIERYSPVYPGVEGRITFVKPDNRTGPPSPTEGNSGTEGTTKRITRFLYCPDMDYTNEASSLLIQQNRIILLPFWITIFYINLLF